MKTLTYHDLMVSGRTETWDLLWIGGISLGLLVASMISAVLLFGEPMPSQNVNLPLHHGIVAEPGSDAPEVIAPEPRGAIH